MNTERKPIAWTIAASDSGGGAGIQADLKTFFDLGVHGCSAITALTAQNTKGVHHVQAMDGKVFQQQLDALTEDLKPKAIKVGVLPAIGLVHTLKKNLQKLQHVFVVMDPVLAPTSGKDFVDVAMQQIMQTIFPCIDLLTPNIPEADLLTGMTIKNTDDQLQAAQALLAMGAKAVLLKGGHAVARTTVDQCQDVFLSEEHCFWLTQNQQKTQHTHGTGCTLSSAIAAFVACGKPLCDAVVLASAYVSKGIAYADIFDQAGNKKGAVAQTGWPNSLEYFPQVSARPEAINYSPMPICDTTNLGLYPVVDSIKWLEKLLFEGVKTIQLRIKEVPRDTLEDIVAQAAELGRQYDARLFVNDYWQLAIKHNAYGVHLGQEDIAQADIDSIRNAGLHLGVSTHGEYEFSYAATFKPSYLAIGAIFPTDTKEVVEVGLDNLYSWSDILRDHYPLVAIGGINKTNMKSVLRSQVGSVAVVSAITKARDYRKAVDDLHELMTTE